MNVSFRCPACEAFSRRDVASDERELPCQACGHRTLVPEGAGDGERLARCWVCGGDDLYIRKDFPQRLGVAIVLVGFALSSVAWYYYYVLTAFAVLFGFAAIDLLLWLSMGESLVCYRCHSEFRGWPTHEGHAPFELQTHERYRQDAARRAEHVSRDDPAAARRTL